MKCVCGFRKNAAAVNALTKAKALPQNPPRGHVFLRFYLCEVQTAGKNENICEVDEALHEGNRSLKSQALRRLNVLQFMLKVNRRKYWKYNF